MINRITPNIVTEIKPGQILVFGGNSEGRHKKGLALFALQKCGAILGQSKGLQGQSYAIITKKNWWQKRSSTLNEIQIEILDLVLFAMEHPELTFIVPKIGTENAGYSIEEIAPLFIDCIHQRNIHLPVKFWDILNEMNCPFEEPTEGEIQSAKKLMRIC